MSLSFYHPVQIGSLCLEGNLFLAPVAGYSNASFRSICASLGANFTYTELVSSEALVRASQKTIELLRKGKHEKKYAIQLFGGSPENMAHATEIVLNEYDCDCIDINVGCPMPKITKSGGGSVLMKTPTLLFKVVEAVSKECEKFNKPTTVKLRSGWDADHLNWKDCAKACVDAGAKAVCLHPRTQSQRYSGKANWDLISEMVCDFGKDVCVIGSGDLFSPEDALNMLQKTKCNAIMFARGAMNNPFIFSQTKLLLQTDHYEKNIPIEKKLSISFRELFEMAEQIGENQACLQMRKKFASAAKGFENASEIRSKLVACSSIAEYKNVIDYFFKDNK